MRAPTLPTQQLLREAHFSLIPLLSGAIFNHVQVSSFKCIFAGESESSLRRSSLSAVMSSAQIKPFFVLLLFPVIHFPSLVGFFSVQVCFVMLICLA